jgi:hypothetical protein
MQSVNNKVLSFSLPVELATDLDDMALAALLTRSQLLRRLIEQHRRAAEYTIAVPRPATKRQTATTLNMADILKLMFERQRFSSKQSIVVALGIIVDATGRVLIVKQQHDWMLRNASWRFPGCQLENFEFQESLEQSVLRRTGFEINCNGIITAGMIPEIADPELEIAALYFNTTLKGLYRQKVEDKCYTELKWVDPGELASYFTTSISNDIKKYLDSM